MTLKRITLLIVAMAMLSTVASAPLHAAVGFRVYVGPRTFVPPAHPYWYSYPSYPYPYYAPYPGYPYVYYNTSPAYPHYRYGYTRRQGNIRNHEWRNYRHYHR